MRILVFKPIRVTLKKLLIIFVSIACVLYSIACFSQSLDSLKAIAQDADDEAKLHLYFTIARQYVDKQPDSLYFNYLQEALIFSQENEFAAEICSSYYYLGNGFFRKTNYDSSMYYFKQGLEVAEALQDDGLVALMQGNIGRSFLYQGKLKEAKPLFDASMEYARNSGDSAYIMTVLGYLGVYYSNKGDYYNCAEMTFEAMEIAEKLDLRRKQSILLTNLAVLHGRMKDYESALKYQRASLLIDQGIDDKLGLAYGYNNMGNIHRRLGVADSAIYYYLLAKDYHIKMGNMANVASLMTNIGVYFLEANEFEEAHEYFNRAFEIADSMSLIWKKALIIINIGNTYEDQGSYNKAEDYYQMALEIAIDEDYDRHEKDLYIHLAKLYRKTGNYEEAYIYLERFLAIKDSMMTEQNQRTITEMRTKYETEKVEQENEILTQTAQIQELELKRQQTRFWLVAGGIAILLLITVLAFVYYRMRQKNIRTKLEKQSLENEQGMLRSQMNPHFIFNSMNSIQSFISGNDSFTAMTYLSKFAQLMRAILENSRKTMISLEDEVNTLNLYIDLERLRFKNKFKYKLDIDSQIETETSYVPPMLIQPFVENAIKHGLKEKDGDGLLTIIFKKDGQLISCSVSDNGIGREQAIGNKPKDHQSLGMQVTRERLEALKKDKNIRSDFIIHDLKDETGKANGTQVDIIFPFETE